MNKNAIFNYNTPMQVLLASAGVGAGGFAAMRMVKELMDQRKHSEPGKNDNTLTVDLPHSMNNNPVKTAEVPDFIQKGLAVGAGGIGGFMGAKVIYDKVKKQQLQKQIDEANQTYMHSLENFNKPAADNTPHVDALCAKLAEDLEKQGFFGELGSGLLGAVGLGGEGHEAKVNASNSIINEQARHQALDIASLGNLDTLKKTMLIGGGGIGALSFAAMAMARQNKEKAQKSRQFPSNVELNYA